MLLESQTLPSNISSARLHRGHGRGKGSLSNILPAETGTADGRVFSQHALFRCIPLQALFCFSYT